MIEVVIRVVRVVRLKMGYMEQCRIIEQETLNGETMGHCLESVDLLKNVLSCFVYLLRVE